MEPLNYWLLPEQWLNEPDDNEIAEDIESPAFEQQTDEVESA